MRGSASQNSPTAHFVSCLLHPPLPAKSTMSNVSTRQRRFMDSFPSQQLHTQRGRWDLRGREVPAVPGAPPIRVLTSHERGASCRCEAVQTHSVIQRLCRSGGMETERPQGEAGSIKSLLFCRERSLLCSPPFPFLSVSLLSLFL